MVEEARNHLRRKIIPFWKNLADMEYGGFYGWVDFDRKIDKEADKGCILNSRILWFFSNAYTLLGDANLLKMADHAYEFMSRHCIDEVKGGVFWSLHYDGSVADDTKHTYNQAFAIYALSSYYEASKDKDVLDKAVRLYELVENKCRVNNGYLEALDADFCPIANDKLSENGVIAARTMNTLLHLLEAYTELYRVGKVERVKESLINIMEIFVSRVYNPMLQRQEVFFDENYCSLIDLHSYGHDIETSWLLDRTVEILGEKKYEEMIYPITGALCKTIYNTAFDGASLSNECENGITDENRIWWVQAEALVGFLNGYEKDTTKKEYLKAAFNIWEYIMTNLVDAHQDGEWFWRVSKEGIADRTKPFVEPWKCPYHNGRMCFEIIKRGMKNDA